MGGFGSMQPSTVAFGPAATAFGPTATAFGSPPMAAQGIWATAAAAPPGFGPSAAAPGPAATQGIWAAAATALAPAPAPTQGIWATATSAPAPPLGVVVGSSERSFGALGNASGSARAQATVPDTALDKLDAAELNAFRAREFEWGAIPETAPPLSMA